MTDEEIKKMALRFALEKSEGEAYDPFAEEYAAEFLQWLSEKFCIVEKEKARELARLTLEHGWSDDHGLIDGLVDWVCDNFDDEYREEAEK